MDHLPSRSLKLFAKMGILAFALEFMLKAGFGLIVFCCDLS